MENSNRIEFYIPAGEKIPTDLRLYVGDVYVTYERIRGGFAFRVLLDDEEKAMETVKKIIQQMKNDHDESQHGVSWRTISLEVIPQDKRYKIDTLIEWKYRVRDSY